MPEHLFLTEGYAHDLFIIMYLRTSDWHRAIGFDTLGASGSDGLIVWTRLLYFLEYRRAPVLCSRSGVWVARHNKTLSLGAIV